MLNVHDSQAQSRLQTDGESMARSFKGLKVDGKGAITYHGDTSFFHLPTSDRENFAVEDINLALDFDGNRRERMVSNAWEQRALENMSMADIPVSATQPLDQEPLAMAAYNRARKPLSTC